MATNSSDDERAARRVSHVRPDQDPEATLAQHAGVDLSEQEAEKERERKRYMHRVRFYYTGNHYILNKRHSALYCIAGDSEARMTLFKMVDSKVFTGIIAFFIALNCMITILDTPGLRENNGVTDTVFAFDVVFQIIFTIEVILKWFALGVALHRHSYFRSPQNVIDFVIVLIGFVVFGVDSEVTKQLARLVRSMRALGYLTRVAVLKSIFVAVTRSVKKLRDIMLLMSFVIVGMAILGLQVFVGTFNQKCYYDITVNNATNATRPFLDPAVSDMRCSNNPNSGHECGNPGTRCGVHFDIFKTAYLTFDHIGDACFLVFKMVTMDNWPADLKIIQEANGITYFLYGFVIVLFGAYFAMNLVLAILSGEYEEVTKEQEARAERERLIRESVKAQQGNAAEKSVLDEGMDMIAEVRLSESQAAAELDDSLGFSSDDDSSKAAERRQKKEANEVPLWSPSMEADAQAEDQKLAEPEVDGDGAAAADGNEDQAAEEAGGAKKPRTCFRSFRGFMWKYVVNTQWFKGLSIAVTVLNVLILAMDHHQIDKDWEEANNWINFVCSIYFIVEAIIKIVTMLDRYFRDYFNDFDLLLCIVSIPEMILAGGSSGSSVSVLRAFRLARIMRVINTSPRVRQLLITVGNAAAGSGFLFFFLFVYVIFGALFAVIVWPTAVASEVRPNYQNFQNSFLAMFIVISGENWVDETVKVMQGTSAGAVAYYIIYFVFGNYVILNFVVVILIASYNVAAEQVNDEDDMQQLRMNMSSFEESAQRDRRPLDEADPDDEQSKGDAAVKGDATDPLGATPQPEAKDVDDSNVAVVTEPSGSPTGSPRGTALVNVGSPVDKPQENKDDEPKSDDDADGAHKDLPTPVAPGAAAAGKGNRRESLAANEHGQDDLRGSDAGSVRHFVRGEHNQHVTFTDTEGNVVGEEDDDAKGTRPGDNFLSMKFRSLREFQCRVCLADLFGMPREPEEVYKRVEGNSLKIFSETSRFRRGLAWLVAHPYFELLVVLVVIQSCIALGMDNKKAREDADFARLLDFNLIFMVVFFLVECIMKWIAFGVFIGEYAYFKEPWNRLDFFILITSIAALFLPLQAFQSLRVFRLCSKWTSMRIVITSMIHAVPGIANVFFLVAFYMLVAGIMGVQLWKGSFVSCTDEDVTRRVDCIGQYTETSTEVVTVADRYYPITVTSNATRHWLTAFYNFNHIGEAALSLTVLTYGDGWSGVLYNAMDSRDYDNALESNSRWYWAFVVILMFVIGNFFLNNLFVGSLLDSFSAERKRATGAIDDTGRPLLSQNQERWIREYQFALATKLPIVIPKPENPIRRFCAWLYFADKQRIDARPGFDLVVTFLIIANAVFLCSVHYDQPGYWTDALTAAGYFFAIAFTVEFLIKVNAMMPQGYFFDAWNRFDFIIVIFAWVGIFFSGTPGTNGLRVARVARVLRLVKKARGLYRLFESLVYALPALVNVSLLLTLVLFVFGVTGTQLFEELYWDDSDDTALGRFFNFTTCLRSMMLLFQIGTGEAWADILEAAMINEQNSPCTEAVGNCGTAWAIPYFILFMLCANSVAINLFTFIVVDNYMEVNLIADRKSQYLLHRLNKFRRLWVTIDSERTGLMRWEKFVMIIRQQQLKATVEWDEFMEEWGEEDFQDLDNDGEEDISASDVSDEDQDDAPTSPGLEGIRPTTADFRSTKIMNVLARAVGQKNDDLLTDQEKSVRLQTELMGPTSIELTDAYFLRKIRNMRVPVGSGGLVFYDDCLYGITREFYAVDEEKDVSYEAEEFLSAMVDYDPLIVFMVHHALAATKIVKAMGYHLRNVQSMSNMNLPKVPDLLDTPDMKPLNKTKEVAPLPGTPGKDDAGQEEDAEDSKLAAESVNDSTGHAVDVAAANA